jgi:hypothetical protein
MLPAFFIDYSRCVSRHHARSVVRLDLADLSRAEGRPVRYGARPKMMTWGKRRGNVTERFTAGRAIFRTNDVSAKPTPSLFTTRIDTLNSGARH